MGDKKSFHKIIAILGGRVRGRRRFNPAWLLPTSILRR
jgi:hypothetical protein